MVMLFLKLNQREFRTSREETNFQQSLRIKLSKTPLTSTNLARKTLVKFHNQDFKAREISEFNHLWKVAHKSHLRETITKVKLETETCLRQELSQDIRTSNHTQGSHLLEEREATRDLQSTQEALMFTLTKTRCSTLSRNTGPQVTKKMPQLTFRQDHR